MESLLIGLCFASPLIIGAIAGAICTINDSKAPKMWQVPQQVLENNPYSDNVSSTYEEELPTYVEVVTASSNEDINSYEEIVIENTMEPQPNYSDVMESEQLVTNMSLDQDTESALEDLLNEISNKNSEVSSVEKEEEIFDGFLPPFALEPTMYQSITNHYCEKVAKMITATPDYIGDGCGTHTMIGRIKFDGVSYLLYYAGEYIELAGDHPRNDGEVVLVKGQFVTNELFHVLGFVNPEQVASGEVDEIPLMQHAN